MLLEYSIRNFLSFQEGASVSFKLDKNTPVDISECLNYATILCVKGANGSGKTHLLKGLAFIGNFASKSFSSEPDSEIAIDPYFNSNSTSDFSAEFIALDGVTYLYELSVTKNQVHREALYQKKNRKTIIFERINNTISTIKRLSDIKSIIYRNNASVISTLNQHKNKDIKPVYDFFNGILFNVSQHGFTGWRSFDLDAVSKFLLEHPEALEFSVNFIKECDTGITKITIATEEGQDGKKKYFPVFHHSVGGNEFTVYPSTESSGTKYLLRMLIAYFATIKHGGIFIADEFDLYLHPDILPKIISLFINKDINQAGGQLIFSTHNTDIIDICSKYRTILVNKEDNSSYIYRLDEIPGDILRNDRSISKPYKEGRIGGVPRI